METQSSRTNSEAEPEKAGNSRKIPTWMTAAQLEEFQVQAVAYKYIAAGLPVPLHLLVPIWNSLSLSWSHYLSSTIIHHHPYRLSYQELCHRDMVDPEPTRCRRTDGKKWRCGKDVLPFQKYCQRHMHRGCKRSRKLVESPEIASSAAAPLVSVKEENDDGPDSFTGQSLRRWTTASSSEAPVVTIASYSVASTRDDDKNDTVEEAVSRSSFVTLASTIQSASLGNGSGQNVDLNDKDQSNKFPSDDFIRKKRDLSTSTSASVVPVEFYPKNVQGNDRLPTVQSETKVKPGRYLVTSGKQFGSCKEGLFVRRYFPEHLRSDTRVSDPAPEAANVLNSSKKDLTARSRHANCNYSVKWRGMMSVGGCIVPGIHFSPDSVLQAHGGFPLNRAETEKEPGRCRRTDGKKWRCSKDALPCQKYCPKHMHRGVKKRPVDTDTAANTSSVPYAVGSASCKDRDDNATPDTKLSVSSVLANPLRRGFDEKSTSSCSTDTTITDTALRGKDNDDLSTSSGV